MDLIKWDSEYRPVSDECVCVLLYQEKTCTHKHRPCAVSVPEACDLSTIIRTDVEEEIISIFTRAFVHLGNEITVGEDYGSGLGFQSVWSVYSWSTNQPGTHINTKHKHKEIV